MAIIKCYSIKMAPSKHRDLNCISCILTNGTLFPSCQQGEENHFLIIPSLYLDIFFFEATATCI